MPISPMRELISHNIHSFALKEQLEKKKEHEKAHYDAMNKRDKAKSRKQIDRTVDEINKEARQIKHYDKLIDHNEKILEKLSNRK